MLKCAAQVANKENSAQGKPEIVLPPVNNSGNNTPTNSSETANNTSSTTNNVANITSDTGVVNAVTTANNATNSVATTATTTNALPTREEYHENNLPQTGDKTNKVGIIAGITAVIAAVLGMFGLADRRKQH